MRLVGLTLSILLGVLLLQVVTAVVVKMGSCPVVNTLLPCKGPIPRSCRADSDCLGKKKCCDAGCSFKCQEPTVVVKPGTCPVVNTLLPCKGPIPRRCRADSDCPGKKKCCNAGCSFECWEPTVFVKPGTCPVVNTLLPCKGPIPRRCHVDTDCFGQMKCCDAGCSFKCQEPRETKPGTCPGFPIGIMPCSLRNLPKDRHQCNTDKQCTGKQKCCLSDCWYICAHPEVVVKQGMCPVGNTFVGCKLPIPRSCNVDSDCLGKKLCCDIGCSYKCWEPRE